MTATAKNPVIRSYFPNDFPGWNVRCYADGMWDAIQTDGPGLSPGFESLTELSDWMRSSVHGLNQNYSETVALARKVVAVADEEISRGMPNPTCGMTCYRLAVALLHAETVSTLSSLQAYDPQQADDIMPCGCSSGSCYCDGPSAFDVQLDSFAERQSSAGYEL